MKLNITQKLFLIAVLPIVALVIYSLNHLSEKYNLLLEDKQNIVKLQNISYASNLIHEIQIERGASASFLYQVNNEYFSPFLDEQKRKTDLAIESFQKYFQQIISSNDTQNLDNYFSQIKSLRAQVSSRELSPEESFNFYTQLNKELITLINKNKFSEVSRVTNANIASLFHLIKLQEYAGQERALVSKFIALKPIQKDSMKTYHNLLLIQENEYISFLNVIEHKPSKDHLIKMNSKYKASYLDVTREEILNHEKEQDTLNAVYNTLGLGGMLHDLHLYNTTKNQKHFENFLQKQKLFDKLMSDYITLSNKKDEQYEKGIKLQNYFQGVTPNSYSHINDAEIFELYTFLNDHHITLDAVKWFEISTERINELHMAEKALFDAISADINNNIKENNNFLFYQIIATVIIIISLLLANYLISKNIRLSIASLDQGINKFFDFLNGKTEIAEEIHTNSHDEINDMAQNINKQVQIIQKALEKDLDFINETTEIVTLMKDGNFSERPYFEPHNPHLKDLKEVFNELIELIAQKIKEQTDSLETLNASLEERVHFQTLELEKQIEEITVAMDKAIAAEKAKDEFLANMSHEIRTPLNAILGFVTILKKQIKEEKPLHYLNIIDTSGKSLLTIINDILDFSKIQSGKFTITPHDVNVMDELSSAALLFSSKAYEKHLVYAVYIDPNMPQIISMDSVRVKQIFSNLLSNAIKFTPDDGAIKVKVILKNSHLIISVQDTGIGIPQKSIAKVFSAFEQADGSTTRKYGGTGLGLSISRKLAELMGGDITLQSKEGVGSTFTLTIPVTIKSEKARELLSPTITSTWRVAILGENPKSKKLTVIRKYLQDFGVTQIDELGEYKDNSYDLLFFVPDDSYNEEIVNGSTPSIALLRTSSVKLAELDHIQALYAPYTPTMVVAAIKATGIYNPQTVLES